jgi:hypothetical protein
VGLVTATLTPDRQQTEALRTLTAEVLLEVELLRLWLPGLDARIDHLERRREAERR